MSWSVQAQGTKEAVSAHCKLTLGRAIDGYESIATDVSKAEAQDIRNALDSILRAIDYISFSGDLNGVKVSANGSRSTSQLAVRIDVERIEFRQ